MDYSVEKMMFNSTKFFSVYTTTAFMYSMAKNLTPEPVKYFLHTTFSPLFQQFLDKFFSKFSTQMTIVVNYQNGLIINQVYDSAQTYLPTKINPNNKRVHANKSEEQKTISLSIGADEEIIDFYKSVQLKWRLNVYPKRNERGNVVGEERYFELTFKKPHTDIVVNEYLPFVMEKAKQINDNEKELKLCRWRRDNNSIYGESWYESNGDRGWDNVIFNHPVTFDKLAMDPNLKDCIIEDLDRFVKRKEYYKKVGKAWKRGYLLYGPPGTGKSSLVAAMANYLRFNVYDLELAGLQSDSELRSALLKIRNRSIIVIEDIDCSSRVQNRNTESEPEPVEDSKKKAQPSFTLSGLLNFIDGLWSTCGNERIIIFTTNHKEKLDPALLRPGRMDMHIHMGYCPPEGFDVLAFNYLGIQDHPKLIEINGLIKEVNVTPAELAEQLMRNDNANLALEGVLDLLKRKDENSEMPVTTANDILSVGGEENGGEAARSLKKLIDQLN